jgi:hypothetical protein
MNYKKTITSAMFLFLGFGGLHAQENPTASGGDVSGSGGSVAYSVGQIVYNTHAGITGSVAQGVQQPYEISITTGLLETDIKLNLSAYPNPTTSYLMLEIDASTSLSNQSMSYQLFDIGGKLLESKSIVENTTTIKMEQLVRATYFLKVTQNNTLVKTFKVIKN